ncbi:ribonuclease H1 small subunit [Hypomontagnella submonticulosa]|nr:ribonuclease H1 small subunit [Hypomontagnella submonticulosa]
MSHSIFAVKSQDSVQKKAHVHLLPCRIHHDGNVDPMDSYWDPSEGQADRTKTAYLRGRKLNGKAVKLPEGYYGSIVEKSEPKKPEDTKQEETVEVIDLEEESDDQLETGTMQGKATFDEVMIWNHESLADSGEDPYLRGMEEWISFAEQVRQIRIINATA